MENLTKTKKFNDGLTPQRRWQLKKQEGGCCVICGRERGLYGTKSHCVVCKTKHNVGSCRRKIEMNKMLKKYGLCFRCKTKNERKGVYCEVCVEKMKEEKKKRKLGKEANA